MSRSFSELAGEYSAALGARAAWFLPAAHVPEAMAKLGLVGPADRLVVCADDFAAAFSSRFPERVLRFAAEPTAEAFLAASDRGAADDASGPDSASMPGEPAHHVSYAHAAGANVERLFWFVDAIGCRGLRVPDIRALGRAARAAGAILVVDATVPSHFGCDPLALGAHVAFEALDRVGAGRLPRKLVGLAVARSVTGRGRKQRTDALAEQAYLLLAMRLGQGAAPSGGLAAGELELLDEGLASMDGRMQRHMDNARAIAAYLEAHPAVPSVAYPGLASHTDHAVAANVLRHGFGPAVDFELPAPITAASFIAACDPSFRAAPAGGPSTRLSARDGGEARAIRLFAGTDDPLATVDAIDRALRMLGGVA